MEARNKSYAKFDPSGCDGTSFVVTGPRFFTEKWFASNDAAVEAHPSGFSDVMSHMHTGDEHMETCDEFSRAGNNEESRKSRLSLPWNNAVDQAFSVQAGHISKSHVSFDKQCLSPILAFAGAPARLPVESHYK